MFKKIIFLSIYNNLDYTNSYFEQLLNKNLIKSILNEQLERNYSFLNKSFNYKILEELKRVNSKIKGFLIIRKDLINNNQITHENYNRNNYLKRIKNLTNYNRKQIVSINMMNYDIPNDYKVFENVKNSSNNKYTYDKSEFKSILQKIYKNYDNLYGPIESIIT